MADLDALRQGWDSAAREDAFFNILTHPGKQNGEWDPEDFFGRGVTEINEVLDRLSGLGVGQNKHRALDFGCGVGRLTQALGDRYRIAFGVDVSEEMVVQAREWANDRGRDNCRYHHNPEPDLSLYKPGVFDLVYSMITLQHMPNELQRAYIEEFLRIIKPDGLAVFQVPAGPDYHHPNDWLSMYGADRYDVTDWVTDAGGKVVDIYSTGHDGGWDSLRYVVCR